MYSESHKSQNYSCLSLEFRFQARLPNNLLKSTYFSVDFASAYYSKVQNKVNMCIIIISGQNFHWVKIAHFEGKIAKIKISWAEIFPDKKISCAIFLLIQVLTA